MTKTHRQNNRSEKVWLILALHHLQVTMKWHNDIIDVISLTLGQITVFVCYVQSAAHYAGSIYVSKGT